MQDNSIECQYVRVKIPRCTICGGELVVLGYPYIDKDENIGITEIIVEVDCSQCGSTGDIHIILD